MISERIKEIEGISQIINQTATNNYDKSTNRIDKPDGMLDYSIYSIRTDICSFKNHQT